MHAKNGRPIRLEEGVPGYPRMHHLAMHRACDRFLESRGLTTVSSSRRNTWLFGKSARRAK
jgi:hypothetical protein